MAKMRLQKFLARAGVASRRKCDEEIIPSGRVTVNGDVVTKTGSSIDPDIDEVRIDGERLRLPQEHMTLMLNKPKGYETTMASQHGAKIVSQLVPVGDFPGLVPVGRLDKDTTGLLLFTTDGELCNGLMHPSHKVGKTYEAKVRGRVTQAQRRLLETGVEIDGRMTAPAKCEIGAYDPKKDVSKARMTIHEGRNRQVRKMFAAVGHEVVALHRSSFGDLSLGGLKPGEWRPLTPDESRSLK